MRALDAEGIEPSGMSGDRAGLQPAAPPLVRSVHEAARVGVEPTSVGLTVRRVALATTSHGSARIRTEIGRVKAGDPAPLDDGPEKRPVLCHPELRVAIRPPVGLEPTTSDQVDPPVSIRNPRVHSAVCRAATLGPTYWGRWCSPVSYSLFKELPHGPRENRTPAFRVRTGCAPTITTGPSSPPLPRWSTPHRCARSGR